MSGGHFDYYQHHINEIAEQLERNIADIEYGKSIGKVKKQELCAYLVDVEGMRIERAMKGARGMTEAGAKEVFFEFNALDIYPEKMYLANGETRIRVR